MRKVRIAQIGTSQYSHGSSIIRSLKKQPELFDLVGYAMPEGEKEKFPKFIKPFSSLQELSVEEILIDPTIEAVAVETEEIYLTKYAQMAAEAGKHIHMEKPGSQDLAAFQKLIATVQEKNLVFHTGYMYRYNPMVQELLQEIRRGELGKILSVEAQMSGDQPADLRQWLTNFKGGMMFYLGCHLLDLILQIQGQPQKVIPVNKCTGLDGAAGEDIGMAVLEYAGGISMARTNANQLGGYAMRELTVIGSKKTVSLRPMEMPCPGGQTTTRTDYTSTDWFHRGDSRESTPEDRYNGMMAGFAAMVRGEKENPYTPEYELRLFKLILKCCGM